MKRLSILAVAMLLLVAPAATRGLEPEEAEDFLDDWSQRFDQKDAATISDLLAEWREFLTTYGVDGFSRKQWSPHIERWRTLIDDYFLPGDVETAMAIVACESNGDPLADSDISSAKGLWQHLGRYWRLRSSLAGVPGASIWHPEASTIVASWLVYNTRSSWRHWTCFG